MTDQELKDLVASLAVDTNRIKIENAVSFAEIRAAQAKTDAQMAKTDKKLASMLEMLEVDTQGMRAF